MNWSKALLLDFSPIAFIRCEALPRSRVSLDGGVLTVIGSRQVSLISVPRTVTSSDFPEKFFFVADFFLSKPYLHRADIVFHEPSVWVIVSSPEREIFSAVRPYGLEDPPWRAKLFDATGIFLKE